MVVAEAAQKLWLSLISKDGEIHEDEAEKWSIASRSSLDSTSTSVTISSSTISTNFKNLSNIGVGTANNYLSGGTTDELESEVGGVPNRFLGITPAYLRQTQLQRTPISMGIAEYQVLLSREIGSWLDAKCNKLADYVVIDDLIGHQNLTSRLHETYLCFSSLIIHPSLYLHLTSRVNLILEEIEREESAWRADLYSPDRKFAEYYYSFCCSVTSRQLKLRTYQDSLVRLA